jgi:hypothetical protein
MRIERLCMMEFDSPAEAAPRSSEALERPGGIFFGQAATAPESLDIIRSAEMWPGKMPKRRQLPVRKSLLALGAAGIALLLYGSIMRVSDGRTSAQPPESSASIELPPLRLPPPNLLRPLSPGEAVKENAERPFVIRPDTPARRFVLHTDAQDRERALTCLSQAVYYEAAGEGVDGERAVAQVVLNRMRHPGFPASVCGVVYQGADRSSGCQFTFACDGSLLRTPVPSLWARARKIAEDALSGHVFAPVGHATHYHADYVLPYWADSLDKSVQIGRHIFYRLPSVLGDSRSFFQHYAGVEPQLPQPKPTDTLQAAATTEQLASALISDDPNIAMKEVEKAAEPASPLVSDSSHGTLIGDVGSPAIGVRKPKAPSECPTASDNKQITALTANDLRSGASAPRC